MENPKKQIVEVEIRWRFFAVLILTWLLFIASLWVKHYIGAVFWAILLILPTFRLLDPRRKIIWFGTEEHRNYTDKIVEEQKLDLGPFTFFEGGFFLKIENESLEVFWKKIEAVLTYKSGRYSMEEICLAVFCDEGVVFEMTDFRNGWEVFIEKMTENLPNLNQNWLEETENVAVPNKTTLIFQRENRGADDVKLTYTLDKITDWVW